MKKVLSLLLAFVFLQVTSQAYAPAYGGNQAALSGTYAGVLSGVNISAGAALAGSTSDATKGVNSLGIFIIGVPKTDVAQGSMALFANGVFYQGGILAIADPNKDKLTGVAQLVHIRTAQSTTQQIFGLQQTSQVSFSYDSQANGSISTKINLSGQGVSTGTTTIKGTGSFTVANLVETPITVLVTDPVTGNVSQQTTLVDTFPPAGTLSFNISGFLQSTTVISPNADSIAGFLNGSGNSTTAGGTGAGSTGS